MESEKRTEYRQNVISPIFSLLGVSISTVSMFYLCGDGKTVFNDKECINKPRYLHIWGIVNSCGYFLMDTVIILVNVSPLKAFEK